MRKSACIAVFMLMLLTLPTPAQDFPTLEDFWAGRAEWVVDIADVGLPVGESDTLIMENGEYWSYLHASYRSDAIIDQCGQPVEFPGCLTLWRSDDATDSFSLDVPVCLIPCRACPCDDQRDHITAQQYPRVYRADDGIFYMVYEWHAQTIIRTSNDGITWTQDWEYMIIPGEVWPRAEFNCADNEVIGAHPNIRGEGDVCLVGGPPGLYIEGDMLYVFVMSGSAPSNLRCYKGNRHDDLGNLQRCDTDPLFTGAQTYGDETVMGADANAYFDFRYISSADILQVGEYYYMAYEGIRGPSELEFGRDNQFGLGFARARELDSAWDMFSENPVVMDLGDNWGIGHADLFVIDGITYMISATSQDTRGRYVLQWRE